MRFSPSAFALAFTLALPAAAPAEDDALRTAHEAVRAALLERATLPARPPSLPDGATMMEPDVRAEHARRAEAEREAHERAVRRGEQHRARHMDGDHGADDGPRGGMQSGDSAGRLPRGRGDGADARDARRHGRRAHGRWHGRWPSHGREMSGGVALHALALALALALGAPDGGAEAHLLAGAAHFRAARYAEALVEFRVAERLGEREAAAYAGAALVKLERWDEAVETFETAVPGGHPLHDYYHALACYGARLYTCADRLLADVGDRSGPRIAEQARGVREEIAGALSAPPSETSLAWYRARCEARRAEGRTALADAYCREADALAARRVGATRAAGVDTAAAPRNGGGP